MAVTIPLVFTNAQAQQIAADVGEMQGLAQPATAQEVHDWIWKLGKAQIMNWRRQKGQALVAEPADIGDAG